MYQVPGMHMYVQQQQAAVYVPVVYQVRFASVCMNVMSECGACMHHIYNMHARTRIEINLCGRDDSFFWLLLYAWYSVWLIEDQLTTTRVCMGNYFTI